MHYILFGVAVVQRRTVTQFRRCHSRRIHTAAPAIGGGGGTNATVARMYLLYIWLIKRWLSDK